MITLLMNVTMAIARRMRDPSSDQSASAMATRVRLWSAYTDTTESRLRVVMI
jgi:hypothetical protein